MARRHTNIRARLRTFELQDATEHVRNFSSFWPIYTFDDT
jgi:hypothetical protein